MNKFDNQDWRRWMAVAMLGIAAFTVVTTELAPIGMLTAIANETGKNAGTTGLVVTLYAWLGAVVALFSVTTISHLPRRGVLVILMLLLAMSNGVSAMSDNFNLLLMARLVGAIAHGAFWAMIGTMGAQLVATHHVGRATAIIFGGVSTASVLGIPLINWISHHSGWRSSFIFLGGLSVVTAIALLLVLPSVPGTPRLQRHQFNVVLQNGALRKAWLIALFSIVAHFAAFTYIDILLSTEISLPARWVTICLFAFGLAGLAGNFLCGITIDRHLKRMLSCGLLLIAFCLATTSASVVHSGVSAMILVSGWGLGAAILFVGLQSWIIRLAGENALPASAIYAAIFNGAIGAGAILGTGVLKYSSISTLFLLASLTVLMSFSLLRFSTK